MADNSVKEEVKAPQPPQPATDDNRRRTRSQTRNGGVTPPAPVVEARGRKRASLDPPGSASKRGRRPAASEHSKQENKDLPQPEETSKQQKAQHTKVEEKPKEAVKESEKTEKELGKTEKEPAKKIAQPKPDNQDKTVNEADIKAGEVRAEDEVKLKSNSETVSSVVEERAPSVEEKAEEPVEQKDSEQKGDDVQKEKLAEEQAEKQATNDKTVSSESPKPDAPSKPANEGKKDSEPSGDQVEKEVEASTDTKGAEDKEAAPAQAIST